MRRRNIHCAALSGGTDIPVSDDVGVHTQSAEDVTFTAFHILHLLV